MRNGHTILALYETATLSVMEWHELVLQLVGKCETPEQAQRLHEQFELAEIVARVSNDDALETNFREGKLRLKIFLGLWSRGLEKAPGTRTELIRSDADRLETKKDQLKSAGISQDKAERYEQLLGPKDKQAEGIAAEATELYLAKQREQKSPGTMKGLLKAVQASVDAAFPPSPKNGASKNGSHTVKDKQEDDEPITAADEANNDWVAWMMDIDDLKPELAADGEYEQFSQKEFDRSERAVALIRRYQARLMKRFKNVATKA
jgi:hypothetical protein